MNTYHVIIGVEVDVKCFPGFVEEAIKYASTLLRCDATSYGATTIEAKTTGRCETLSWNVIDPTEKDDLTCQTKPKRGYVRRLSDKKVLALLDERGDEICVEEMFLFADSPTPRPLKLWHPKNRYETVK